MVIRIAFVITGLATGGAETMLLKVLERLGPDFEPHVLSLSGSGDMGPRIQALGIPVHAIGMRAGLPNPWLFLRLVDRLRILRPDVVHTWMYHADLLGGLAARVAGVRAVGWCIRNSDLDVRHTKASTRLVVTVCALLSRWIPRRILCCSVIARDIHAECGYDAGRMEVVPNGFDLSLFLPDMAARDGVRRELGLHSDCLVVGMMGRFDPQKDHEGFLRAASLVHSRLPAVHFIMAGNGVESGNVALAEGVRTGGLQHVVHMLGLRSDMPRLMASLDVLVLSSKFGEAFPNVVGEAMSCGIPCVVTDVGDSASIVADTGRVVRPNDVAALAAAMYDVLTLSLHERSAWGRRARERVVENFDITHVVHLYEDFFRRLAGKSSVTGGAL